jgi:hypothetical protein
MALHKKGPRQRPPAAAPKGAPLERLAARLPAGVTLRLQWVQCGKPRCKAWHGPYWYAFWWTKGKTRSAYVGKDAALERFQRARGKGARDHVTNNGEGHHMACNVNHGPDEGCRTVDDDDPRARRGGRRS